MNLLKHIFPKKIVLDANVILRYLLNDNEELSKRARDIISTQRCIMYLEVVCEVVFVLQSKKTYNIPREEIKAQLVNLSYEVEIDKYDILKYALEAYCGKPKLDFVDCLLYGYNKSGYDIVSFDDKINKKILG